MSRPPRRRFLERLRAELAGHSEPHVLLLAGPTAPAWSEVLAELSPSARVDLVGPEDDPSSVHVRLSVRGPYDVALHAADAGALSQARLFQRVFMHLRPGGTYLTPTMLALGGDEARVAREQAEQEELAATVSRVLPNEDAQFQPAYVGDLWEMVSEALAARLRDFQDDLGSGVRVRDVRGLGRHLGPVTVTGRALGVGLRGTVHVKLTEAEADAVLTQRPELGHEVTSLPPTTFTARSRYRHDLEEDRYIGAHFEVPKLTLREYAAPTCARGQVVASGRLLMPDTFRHHLAPRLQNGWVRGATPLFGTVQSDLSAPEELPGAWFHLDSEWPGHFGHLLTEQLGRMWAWERAREHGARVLMTLQRDREPYQLKPFEIDVLAAFGIDQGQVHLFDGSCRPERLFAATSMFSLPDYVHPDITAVWDRVGDHLAAQATDIARPRRIFCRRPEGFKRSCHNAAEVEALFAAHGFDIVRPELLSMPEQVALFRSAEVVGGFGGSALFTLAMCRTPKKVFTVAPTSYTARNEHLIAAVRGHEVVSAWATPDEPHPQGRWTQRAYSSHFRVDMDREGAFLARELALLDR